MLLRYKILSTDLGCFQSAIFDVPSKGNKAYLHSRGDFFEIVSKRYEKGSIIITSNRSVHQWDSVFIDKTLTT
ncbi:hypothetical protein COU88_04325, partial [Candidatus Roizmanbacteria bacterium CG10_big_fil_rev_8_21_14_0_10_39_6]